MPSRSGIQVDDGDDELEYWDLPKSTIERWEEHERVAKAARIQRHKEWLVLENLRIAASKMLPEIAKHDGTLCRHCGATQKLTVDRIIPRSRGGTNDLDNLQLLCRACNSRKGAR